MPVPVAVAVVAPTLAAPVSADGPRRSGIQIALIVVGVSLLSVFAVFGLVYAFVSYGGEVRMAIIVAGTLATMIAAGVLGRRGLTKTAEGVAALGTVMLVLDAWAVRLNDPSGLGSSPELLYWGVALLIVGATAALWSRLVTLATPAIVSAGLLPVGAALVTGHLVDRLLPAIGGAATTAAALAGLITAALAWTIVSARHPTSRRAAQIVALTVGAISASIALVSLVTLDPGARYSPAIAGLVLAGAALLHVVTLAPGMSRVAETGARRPFDTLALGSLGSGAALAAIVGAIIAAARFDQDRVIVSAPLVAAAIIAVLAEQGWRRAPASSAWRPALSAGALTAAALAALAGGLAAIVGSAAFVEASAQGREIIPLDATDPVTSAEPATVAALGALALVLGLVALSWATLGVLLRQARAVTLIAGIVFVAAIPLLPAWWFVMVVFGVLGLGGGVGLRLANRIASPDARRALVALCIPLSTGAALGAIFIGWAVERGWAVGLLIALLAIGVARPATSITPLRAAVIATAAALVLGSMPELAGDLALALPDLQVSGGSMVIVAAAVIIASAQAGRLAAVERHAVGGVSLLASVIAASFAASPGADEAVALTLLTAALSLVAARGASAERLVARALLPLAVARGAVLAFDGAVLPIDGAVLAIDGTDTAPLDPSFVAVIALGALIGVVAVGLLSTPTLLDARTVLAARARTVRSTVVDPGFARLVGDVAATVAGVTLVIGVATENADDGLLWLPVLTLAVLLLTTAISRDGLIGSASARRFIGWLALGTATIALWMRLADAGETAPEPYVLPLAGAMLLIVAASALLDRRRASSSPASLRAQVSGPRSAAPLTAAALLIALLVSAVQSVDGTPLRAIGVGVVAVALTIAPLLAEKRIDARLPGMSTALVGAGVVVLTVLALAQTLDLLIPTRDTPLEGAELLRAALIVIVPSAVAVTARVLADGRVRDAAAAIVVGVAALCAGALGLTGAIDPVELVSVPLALAALAIGTLHLDATRSARSWPWLGPGFAVLLGASLLAIDGAGEPLWRAIAIGVAAASVFAGGLWRRLQAPFVLGGAALLIHLLVQSWPLLEQVGRAVEWWLWLGLAGVIVIVLAARYERRLQNVRDAATRIAQLR